MHVPVCFLSPLQPQAKARKPRAKSKSKTDLLRKCIEDKIQLFDGPAPEDLLEKVSAPPRLLPWHWAGPAAVRRAHGALGLGCRLRLSVCGCPSPPNAEMLNRRRWTCPSHTPLHRLLLSGTFFLCLCARRSPVTLRPPQLLSPLPEVAATLVPGPEPGKVSARGVSLCLLFVPRTLLPPSTPSAPSAPSGAPTAAWPPSLGVTHRPRSGSCPCRRHMRGSLVLPSTLPLPGFPPTRLYPER